MGDMGDVFRGMREQRQHERNASYMASLDQHDLARKAIEGTGLSLIVANGGHHWRFMLGRKTVLSFWPASAKAQVPGRKQVKRCHGWKHAVRIALQFGGHGEPKRGEKI